MASIRIGIASEFNLVDSKVGVGTTNPTELMDVRGQIYSDNSIGAGGISTVTTYQGFLDTKQTIKSSVSEGTVVAGSLSEEIVVEGEVTVSSGTTYTSGTENLTVTDNFTLPGISDYKPTVGTTRFNEDLGSLEFYTGVEWRAVNSYVDNGNRGRMLVMGGGYPSQVTDIQLIQINTSGNSTMFGDLTVARSHNTALANEIRGMCLGGHPEVDNIDYVTMASEGNAIDFGNLTSSKYGGGGAASSTRGLFCGGFDNPANTNDIDYLEIMTLGNSIDFGDLTRARRYGTSVASPTRVVTTGGTGDSYSSTDFGARMTDIFTISSKGDAIDFAPLTDDAEQMCGFANANRGIFPLTADSSGNTGIDQLNLASGGNATHHGDLGRKTSASPAGGGNHIRGLVAGGFNTPGTSTTNHIDMIEIQTSGNAVDFGDLASSNAVTSGCSDSHGGLGGF